MNRTEATIDLSGDLTMREVPVLWHRLRSRFESDELPRTVDLGDVRRTDSSALALLLEWQALAVARGRDIRFENPPESLRVIARLTEVDTLLEWNGDQDGDDQQ